MIVCICKAVSEKDVAIAILSGCETFEQLLREKNIAADCKKCIEAATAYFDELKNELDI